MDALEEQIRTPAPIDEHRMLDLLGEETTRLLRSARDAADDMRGKAEERASSILKEAQDESQRLRDEADAILGVRTGEAEAARDDILRAANEQAAEVRSGVERYAEEQRLRVDRESEAALEAARTQGREMIEEAKSLRERILADLGRRRALLQGQVEELRSGRDRLLDAYRVVKRTFLEATEALAQVEARAAERTPIAPVAPEELALVESIGADGAVPQAESRATEAEPGTAGVATDEDTEAVAGDAADAAVGAPEAGRALADVDSLFARLREERASGDGDEAAEDTPADVADEVAEPAEDVAEPADVVAERAGGVPEGSPACGTGAPTPEEPPPPEGPSPVGADLVAARDRVLTPLLGPLTKRAKRAAQDEQNEVLDAVRRQKARPTSAAVLAGHDEQVAAWVQVLGGELSTAYAAGAKAVSDASGGTGSAAGPSTEVLAALVEVAVVPLRERVAVAVDDVADVGTDTEGLVVERIGARYREWKIQALSTLLGDALAAAYARGSYDASPAGAMLGWFPSEEGRCPDCDDNALEPTQKGESFPTGQPFPPAHPGCRCLTMPER